MGALPRLLSWKVLGLDKRELGPEQTQKVTTKNAIHWWIHLEVWRTGLPSELPGRKPGNLSTLPPQSTKDHPGRSNEGRSAPYISGSETTSGRSSLIQTNNWQHHVVEGSHPSEPISKQQLTLPLLLWIKPVQWPEGAELFSAMAVDFVKCPPSNEQYPHSHGPWLNKS